MAKIEICVDNLESISTANRLAIDRIELCSALALGGISPNYGLLKAALALSHHPIALMVRPRAGDFLFNEAEIQAMLSEIELAQELGVQHIVIGALTTAAEIDILTTKRLIAQAGKMQVTFHRAFDLCQDPFTGVEQLIDLGCHRILTSGQGATALQGIEVLEKLVKQADGRIQIMAGCGVNATNVQTILQQTQVPEIHFSAKGFRFSKMQSNATVAMGNNEQDSRIERLDEPLAKAILAKISEIEYFPQY